MLSLRLTPEQIDWNKVARNPILSQEITNGHAARMRYSRFRASLLGIEPQRRNRNPKDSNKSKVTKSKKEPKSTKKEKDEPTPIKSDPGTVPKAEAATTSPRVKNETNSVKKEAAQNDFRFTAAGGVSPLATTLPENTTQLQFARLLTPCSDSTELFAPSHCGGAGAYVSATSPISAHDAMLQHHHRHHHETAATGFEYTTAVNEQQQQAASPWHPTSPSYSPFQLPPYELDNFNSAVASGYCDHTQHHHHHHPDEGFVIEPGVMMAPDQTHAPVKHEEWDSGFH